MRPVSDAFLRALRGSHTAITRVRVVESYQTGVDPTGTELSVLEGTVTMDATADIRTTLDITVDGTGLYPDRPGDLLAPFGNELFVERGIEVSGVREWVGLGYFRIYTVDQDDPPNGPIRIEARDRMSGLIDSTLPTPVTFAPQHLISQVYERLVREVYPDVEIEYGIQADAIALNRAAVVEEDRFAFLRDVARSFGCVVYFDYAGRFQVAKPPDPDTPLWTVDAGPNGVLVSMSRGVTRDGIYNAVVVEGEASDDMPPVRAVARDMGPTSPTFWNGRFGQVPARYSNPTITRASQAAEVAQSLLAQRAGAPRSISFGVIPNPALEPLDPILLRFDPESPDAKHVVNTLSLGLGPQGTMEGTTREITNMVIDTAGDL